jgi:nucleotide-binding universal stress UspA family protein
MYDTLLVPVDETAETTRLTERAIALADTWDATLRVVGVVDGPTALRAEAVDRGDRVSGARERARRASMRAAERARRAGVDAHGTVRRGVPHAEIVDESRRLDADLVLLGRPGRETTDAPVCSGRVTNRVVARADCAVLVEETGAAAAADAPVGEQVADTSPDAVSTRREETSEERPLAAGPQ